jgi:[acyl-carrier-protein] S-malonyltransferase
MQSAQDALAPKLAAVPMQAPGIPVVCNFAAKAVSDSVEIRSMLEKQVTGSVRWTESIQTLIAMGHRQFIELGPGKVIAGLVAKIDKDATVISVEDLPSLEAATQQLA